MLEYWNTGKCEYRECWNTGIMGTLRYLNLKYSVFYGINNAMDRKNVNRGFKKLRVWQDAVSPTAFFPAPLWTWRP